MTLMQKAVTPPMSAAYLTQGFDRVAGFVVPADSVAYARTPRELFDAHGLGFPGTPFSVDAPFVDVLRFPSSPQLRFENAIGGTDEATRRLTGGKFIDREPFTGTGFAAAPGHVIPVYWLVHSRVTPGSELIRIGADGSSTVLARFGDVGTGWVSASVQVQHSPSTAMSQYVGPLAKLHGTHVAADVLPDGNVVVVSEVQTPPELGFEPADTGRWRRVVPRSEVEELFELHVGARWMGLEMRVVDSWKDRSGAQVARVTYIGHDADMAEAFKLEKIDAGVYEASLPMSALTDVVPSQLIPSAWATPTS